MTLKCETCGAPVIRDQPPDGSRFADLLARIPPHCDTCVAAAELRDKQRDRDKVERDRAARLSERVRLSGLPKIHHRSLIGLDQTTALIEAATDWAQVGGGLLLTGEIGVGKTTLAGAACWTRLQSGLVLWVSVPLLFARLGAGFGTDDRDWALEALSGRGALVLDDLDKARPSEYAAEQVFLAIDQRVEHRKPLLITTNLDVGQLSDRWPEPYGDAIASRIVGYCTVIRVDGDDRRLSGS